LQFKEDYIFPSQTFKSVSRFPQILKTIEYWVYLYFPFSPKGKINNFLQSPKRLAIIGMGHGGPDYSFYFSEFSKHETT
jgi:hypothetical protein